MSARDTVDELTEICIDLRRKLESSRDKEELISTHIKKYAKKDLRVKDFQKGLEWFNVSEKLSMDEHLLGKIVILDFFTYCCINCMHVLPDLAAVENEFSVEDGLAVIGVHSAKFSNERDSKEILAAVQRYNINHPVVNDANLSMWRAMGISCWPSLVLLGPDAQLLATFVGEDHKEELFLYVKAALGYFKSSNRIKNHSLPLRSARRLLPARTSVLSFPGKVVTREIDGTEKLVVSDTGNNRILITNRNGEACRVVGGPDPGFEDGNFQTARFNAPQGICVLGDCVYVADNENHAIRKIDLSKRTVVTVAGTGVQGRDYIGGKRGKDQALSSPWDVCVYRRTSNERSVPVLLIALAGSHQIWALFLEDTVWWKKKEYKAGTCLAIVGNGREENRNNCYPHAAGLAQPSGLAVAQESHTVYFADSESSTVRCVHLEDGRVSPVCGADKNPNNLHNFGDSDGSGYDVKLQHPLGVAWHPLEKQIYIADTYNHKIKKVDPVGNCVTLYGKGKPNHDFLFDEPGGLAIDDKGDTVYVADTNNHCIKAIRSSDNTISTVWLEFESEEDDAYEFEIEMNNAGGEMKITFDLEFDKNLKLNEEAPRRWRVDSESDTLIATNKKGNLDEAMTVKILEGDSRERLNATIDFVVCRGNECIPKRFLVAFDVVRKINAPRRACENKLLYVKCG